MAISRDEFKQAFREIVSLEFAHIPDNEDSIDYTFSERFNKRMAKLIKSQRKPYYFLVNTAAKRVAVAVVMILALLGASMSVKAIRDPVVKFIVEIYESFTECFFCGDTADQIKKEYSITKLPDGFVEVDKIKGKTLVTTVYSNCNGDEIEFTQISTNQAKYHLDNEQGDKYVSVIGGVSVQILDSKGLIQAVWIEGQYCLKLTMSGDVDIDKVKQIISNVE